MGSTSASEKKKKKKDKEMKQQKPNKEEKKKRQTTLKEVRALGEQLLTSRSHINNLPILVGYVSPDSPPEFVVESLLSLHSFFAPLLPDLPPSSSKSPSLSHAGVDDPNLIYRTWLRSKFDDFVRSLLLLILSPQPQLPLRVHSSEPVDMLFDFLASKYFSYINVRYFTYISLEKLASTLNARNLSDAGGTNDEKPSKTSVERPIRNIHNIISRIPPQDDVKEDSDKELWSGSGSPLEGDESEELSGAQKAKDKHLKPGKQENNVSSVANFTKKMKLKFTKAWLSFLRLPLPVDVYKEVLVSLHQSVIPYLSNPAVLSDFLTRSYDIGGVVSVMALSSLFILMTRHGLEYPDFYEKLYALLLPSIFIAKHRAKFFQLLDSCLKSPLLPAYLAAAFAKKLSRLALVVPPSGSLVIVALIHNLLRRHPSINCLVHREDDYDTEESNSEAKRANPENDSDTLSDKSTKKRGLDHFDNEESNPMKSHALRSSLWEIDTLRHHYCPPVSRFVLSLENDLTVRAKTTEINIEDFSSGSYATIFGEEIRRRVKQVPLAFYKSTPKSLFSSTDFAGWTFQQVESKEGDVANCTINVPEGNDKGAAKRQRTDCN
ncbi:hypothetical protein Tsubulata_014653 [Turnera subulata]|uniref:CCAAT-binding factor domain-containing protein n=1 Tax=Turnera subulata TaxID=218843 RepID=A0A9Q0GDI0_9ROSI|nr:hypothetical protein Tsubulata_014653 [Turnera subulata]